MAVYFYSLVCMGGGCAGVHGWVRRGARLGARSQTACLGAWLPVRATMVRDFGVWLRISPKSCWVVDSPQPNCGKWRVVTRFGYQRVIWLTMVAGGRGAAFWATGLVAPPAPPHSPGPARKPGIKKAAGSGKAGDALPKRLRFN